MNSVSIVGRLARDPELRYTDDGMPVAKFRVAVSRPVKKGPDGNRPADFIPVTAFRKTAEIVAQYAHQGDLVSVIGVIQTRRYQDPTDPTVTRYGWGVVANRVGFLAKKGTSATEDADAPLAAGAAAGPAIATPDNAPAADAAEDADVPLAAGGDTDDPF
jgi:single-strand DNA-binding protein